MLDYDGPWSPDLINLMTPMAEAAELAEKERIIESVGSVFGKDGVKQFMSRAEKLQAGIRARVLGARGAQETPDGQVNLDVATLNAAFGGLGAKKPKGRRR